MKLCMFDDYRPGLVRAQDVVDLSHIVGSAILALPPGERMIAIIEHFDELRGPIAATEGPAKPLGSVCLRAPVPRPPRLLMGQGNYMEGTDTPPLPLAIFLKLPSTVLDPGGTIELTPLDPLSFQHEAELAVIIGKGGKDIGRAKALDHVFGYTCLIDVSARGLGRGLDLVDKSSDTFCPLGPWITTAEEIADPQRLRVRLSVDDALRQDYNTSDMEHPVAALIEAASRVTRLEPGDVIGCGTNHQGLGPIQHGETVTIDIEGIGSMSVDVHDRQQRKWPVGIDPGTGRSIIHMRQTGQFQGLDEAFKLRRIA